jgi:hypothetical protein
MKEGTVVNSTAKNLNNQNKDDFVLEIVENFENLKYEENDEFNTDYVNEVTQDELNNRLMNENDENMKDFYLRQLERINKDPDIFTNKKL